MSDHEHQPERAAALAEARAEADARLREILPLFALPEPARTDELRARGLHPVAVVHGGPESDDDVRRFAAVSALAHTLGSAFRSGGNDYDVYLFPTPNDAGRFAARASEFVDPWWRITLDATPRFGGAR